MLYSFSNLWAQLFGSQFFIQYVLPVICFGIVSVLASAVGSLIRGKM